jgi:hypothetical protein
MFTIQLIMKLFKYILFFLFAGSFYLTSCVKEKSFPPEPKIEFLRYQKYGSDSADCVISFKDGDGDIGLLEDDTVSPDDLKMKYLYKDANGNFQPYDAIDTTPVMDTLFYSYRIKDITPEGQYKALEGEIKARLLSHPIIFPFHSVVRFEIRMRDRAGHWSNTVTSSDITP